MTTLALHMERLELAAATLEAYTGDLRNNRARDVREAARALQDAVTALQPFAEFYQWMLALELTQAVKLTVNGDYFAKFLTVRTFQNAQAATQ